jgi:transposase
MPNEQLTFTKALKLEAVRLTQTSGKSITQVARDLGIADSTCTIGAKYWPSKRFPAVSIRRRRQEEIHRLKRELEVIMPG